MNFQWPMLLFGLALVPLVAGLYLLAQRRRRAYALRFANFALLSDVVTRGPGFRRHVPPLLYLLSLAALLVSLARPTAAIAVPRDQSTFVLVMDVSGSMSADDLKPSRMDAAKDAARAFVEGLPDGARVGLVSFSHITAVQAPPTRDHAQVLRALSGLRPNGGTAIGDGVQVALDQLVDRPTEESGEKAPGMIVLLSDGASTHGSPVPAAATRTKAEGVTVHSIGVGQRGAVPVIGNNQPARLDETSLQELARESGGKYFYAAEAAQLETVYSDLSAQVAWVKEDTEITALVAGLGSALMLAAGLLSLRWFQQVP